MIEMRRRRKVAILPIAYQQVEYLESTGTQYLLLGDYKLEHTNEISITFSITGEEKYRIISLDQENILFYTSDESFEMFTGNWGSTTTFLYSSFPRHKKYTVTITPKTTTLQGVTKKNDPEKSTSGIIWIMRTSQNLPNALMKLYKIVTTYNEFIPCYRKVDLVAGMYDIVNDVFYTNAGTGSFIVGPDIN